MFTWQRKNPSGYEVSSVGDKRFSAFYAKMPDGRSIEHWYQCDIKGYNIGGTNWRAGKGKPSLFEYQDDQQWLMYLSLWRLWTIHNNDLVAQLHLHMMGTEKTVLTDCFANTDVNQARALAQILNEWFT